MKSVRRMKERLKDATTISVGSYRVNPFLYWRSWLTLLTPFVLAAIPLSLGDTGSENESEEPGYSREEALWTLYTILVMAVFWIFELLPLPITSLLPLVLLPLAGVASTDEVARNYLKGTNMMFVASLMMAIAVEHSGFHRRLSLNMIAAIGTSQRLIMLGFMTCTMFLSMWISNTAAVALMVPIVDSICEAMFETGDTELGPGEPRVRTREQEARRNLMLLACAYSANIGGTGVITGTPPNLVVLSTLNDDFGSDHPLSYATWMAFCVPLMLLNTLIAWLAILLIMRITIGPDTAGSGEKEQRISKVILARRAALGRITMHEVQVVALFLALILLWFFQSPRFMPGWADAEAFTGYTERENPSKLKIASATPAVFIVALAFILPKEFSTERSSEALINWQIVEKRLPWGVILLLGGGFALADITKKSGLSQLLADLTISSGLDVLDPLVVSFIIALMSTFVTEVASNTACANILVPILSKMSLSLCSNPMYLMMTCAVCVSYAFMLPVATAPNAIVYAASSMKTSDMMRTGFFMNIICILTTWGAVNTYGSALYGLSEFPAWADPDHSLDCGLGGLNMSAAASLQSLVTSALPSPVATESN